MISNTRLIKLIKTLTPAELKRFESYVASPFINQNHRLCKLITYLIGVYPAFKAKTFSKEYLFGLMFPDEPFLEQKVYDQMSALLRLLEDFLAFQEWEKDDESKAVNLLTALHKKGQDEHFYRVYQKSWKNLSRSNYRNSTFYYHQYKLAHVADPVLTKMQPKEVAHNLGQISHNLETFYLAEKLRISCEMLNRKRILNIPVNTSRADELSFYLANEGSAYLKEPIVAIYFQVYQTMAEPEEEAHFRKLVDLLGKYSDQFHNWQAYSMYVYALNYCVRNINYGKSGFREDMFSLFETLLVKDLLLEQGILSHSHYKNITNVGLSLKKYEWVKNFLEKYKARLAQEVRENAYNYNLSVFYYNQQAYKEAMVLLQQIEFSDVFYHLSAKSLLMRIYFELEDDDGFKYLVHAFQAFIKRNQKIPKYQIQAHQNFIRMLKKVVTLRARRPFLEENVYLERWQKIQANVKESSPMTHARWLSEQIGALQPATLQKEVG